MSAFRLTARGSLRRGWRGVAVVALLVALAGGAVLTAWAGGRRTQSAFGRLLRTTNAADVAVGTNFAITSAHSDIDLSDLAHLPQVERAGTVYGFGIAAWNDKTLTEQDFGSLGVGPGDDHVARDFDAPRLLEGRMPALDAADEIVVNDAQLADLRTRGFPARIGARVPFAWFNFATLSAMADRLGDREPTMAEVNSVFHTFDARIVGRVQFAADITGNENQGNSAVVLSPAFARAHRADASYTTESINLKTPQLLGAFEDAARAKYPSSGLRFSTPTDLEHAFGASTQPYVDAMRLFAIVAAVTTLLVLAQALVRQARSGAEDVATLRSLGMDTHDLDRVVVVRGAVTVLLGIVGAFGLAAALSGRFPIGPARAADPDPGFRIDGLALFGGAAAIALVLGVTVALASRLAVRHAEAPVGGRARRARHSVLRGPTVSSSLGLARAFDARQSRTSLGATLIGVIVAAATCVAAIGFGGALDHFVTQPARWGWHWDAMYETYETGIDAPTVTTLEHRPEITGLTVGTRGTISIGAETIAAFGLDARRGKVEPETLEGRAPEQTGEVAFGARTMRALGVAVGQRVWARDVRGKPVALDVVGRVVVPPSLDLSESHRIGQAAVLTIAGLRTIDPAPKPSFALVDVRPGSLAALTAAGRKIADGRGEFLGPRRPTEVTSYAGVRATPEFLALLLAVLSIGVLAHVMISSARARRREVAVLKAMGLVRRQVAAAVAWEANALVGVCAALGLFFGLAASHLVWRRFTNGLGVHVPDVVPYGALAVAVLALFVLANLIALVPARGGARLDPAQVLRSE